MSSASIGRYWFFGHHLLSRGLTQCVKETKTILGWLSINVRSGVSQSFLQCRLPFFSAFFLRLRPFLLISYSQCLIVVPIKYCNIGPLFLFFLFNSINTVARVDRSDKGFKRLSNASLVIVRVCLSQRNYWQNMPLNRPSLVSSICIYLRSIGKAVSCVCKYFQIYFQTIRKIKILSNKRQQKQKFRHKS